MTRFRTFRGLLVPKVRVMMQFFTAQGLTLGANSLYGLLCVRLLAPSEYAKFVVVFGVQGTLLILMDTNFTATLIPLVGEQVEDRRLIADYVASLRKISVWSYVLIATGALFCYPLLVKNRGWDWRTIAAMVAILLVSTWFTRVSSAYGVVLILLRDRTSWYKGQLISSFGTLALLGLVWVLGYLGPFQAILINVAGIIFLALFCFYRSRQLLGVRGFASMERQRAILRLALPNIPQAVFYALQGQIALLLITFFGHAKGIASVGALARLGQIFALFLQANGLFIEPYFARLPAKRVPRSYLIAVSIAVAISGSVLLVALRLPQLLLWILGPQYRGLNFEVKLVIGAGAVSCVSGVLWGINSARRFVFWWNVILSILLTLVAQIVFIVKFDMSTVRGVLWLNLATDVASLFINILAGTYGFLCGPRTAETIAPADISGTIMDLATDSLRDGAAPVSRPAHHD